MIDRLSMGSLLLSVELQGHNREKLLDEATYGLICQQDVLDGLPHGSAAWLRAERLYRDVAREQSAYALDVAITDFTARALLVFAEGNANETFNMPLHRTYDFEGFMTSTPELFDVAERITQHIHERYELQRGFPTHRVIAEAKQWIWRQCELLCQRRKNS